MYDALHNALYRLRATGANGFEGLMLAHLSRLTGRRFFLAKSGPQGGKDAGTAGYGATYIDIECKRYRRGTSPREQSLIGAFGQAIDTGAGRLDLWLVVSTGVIGNTEAEALRRMADREAVAVEIIDWQEAGLPQLAVLCAAFPEDTLTKLQGRRASRSPTRVAADLKAVRNHPGFSQQLADLQRRLSAADLGFDHARAGANGWIEARLKNKADAMAAFHQALCVEDADFQPYVERAAPQASLDTWYAGWPQHHGLAAVLGLEGNGKSWATMAWWKHLEVRPLTLLITSNRATEDDALTVIASALRVQTGLRDITFWMRRVQQWLQRPPSAAPTILLVLGGLNERPRLAWDKVFASFAASEWAGRLAIVTTCRPPFWSDHVAPFIPSHLPVTSIRVQRFTDDELARAWGDRRPALSEIPNAVRDFIRTPRIFRLARDHVERLMESGDLTVERLLIEDWMDRRRQKAGLIHSMTDFNNLVIALARDLRLGLQAFDRHQLRDYSSLARRSPDRDLDRDFDEIIDGQLFEPVDPVLDQYRVRPEHVGLAQGMLLAWDARNAYRQLGADGVKEVLAMEVDHLRGLVQISKTLRGACTTACLEPAYPAEARRMLLREWLCLPNLDETLWHDFAAYLPLHPDAYFELAEDFWRDEDLYPTGREWITDAILRWRGLPAVQSRIATRCARWLGLWHTDWHPFLGTPDPARLDRQRAAIRDNWSRLTDAEHRMADQLLSPALTPHEPFIAGLALLLLSHGPRSGHVQGFVAWALSRAIMGFPHEMETVAWCLRLNRYDAVETEAALLTQIEALLENASELGIQAARTLLWACGTPAAAARRDSLPATQPAEFRPRQRLIESNPLDPAAPAPPDLAAVMDHLAAEPSEFLGDPWPSAAQRQFDKREPMLTRFAPQEISEFYRRVFRSAPERQGMGLHRLGCLIPKHLLLIGPEEAHALEEARQLLLPILESNLRDARDTEAWILTGVLGHLPAEHQLDLLLGRPESALDWVVFENVFAAVPPERANERLIHVVAEGQAHEIRRLLWFLGHSAFTLREAARNALIRCFNHADPSVRVNAFRLAIRCNDRAALNAHLASGWCAHVEDSPDESFYGSHALIAGANPVDYLALRSRVAPELLGYLALQDGSARAIDALAEDLDAVWETMTQISMPSPEMTGTVGIRTQPVNPATPEPERTSIEPWAKAAVHTVRLFGRGPSASELRNSLGWSDLEALMHQPRGCVERVQQLIAEARQVAKHVFGKRMWGDALAEVMARHPERTEKWIAYLVTCDTMPWDTAEFYRALCAAVGKNDPDRAAEILSRLWWASTISRSPYRSWNVERLTWLALQLLSSPKVDEMRELILDEANTDHLLFHIAHAAQANGALDWLARIIRRDLGLPGMHRVARALTLIGFLDEGALLAGLRHELDGRTGFLRDVAICAADRLERNHWARVWFAEFLAHHDPVAAWAAFRLFLSCVDRRFHLWGAAMRNATLDLPLLWDQQVRLNGQAIQRTAGKNEGKLSDILFGLQTPTNKIAPWYLTPPMAAG